MTNFIQEYFTSYQLDILRDQSERICILKSRRIGITEIVAVKAIVKARTTPHHDVNVVSKSYREAKEIIRTADKWIGIFDKLGIPTNVKKAWKTYIEFENGSRIVALPAEGVRSRGGTVIMDEAAFISDCEEVYKGVSPAVAADPDGQLILISTPLGKSGLFYNVCQGKHGDDWSQYNINIYEAIEQGAHWLPDPEKIKAQEPEDVFLQEYMCDFLGEKDQYFSYQTLIDAKISRDEIPDDHGRLCVGIDIGSSQDQTVVVSIIEVGDTRYISNVKMVKEAGAEKKLHAQQVEITDYLDGLDLDSIAVDGNGLGKQLAEGLQAEFSKVNSWGPSDHTTKPADLVPVLLKHLEDGTLRMVDDKRLRKAFAAIQRKERADRSLAYVADRDADGHADSFFAALMAFGEYERTRREIGIVV